MRFRTILGAALKQACKELVAGTPTELPAVRHSPEERTVLLDDATCEVLLTSYSPHAGVVAPGVLTYQGLRTREAP